MSRCAGVQNVSRPMDMCHEMSQSNPTTTIVAATTTAYACHAQSRTTERALVGEYAGASAGWMVVMGGSEERHLLAERRRIDRRDPEQPLQHTGALGRVSGEVIVNVAVHFHLKVGERPEHAGPRLELLCAIDLDARVVDDVAVGAHPSDVHEVGGWTGREREHLLTRDPACVGERERDVVLGEESEHAVVDPAALPELDGETHVARQPGEHRGERGQLDRPEVGSELDQNRTELLAELAGAVVELERDIVGVAQPALVRDLLRELQREGE